ncbi:fluoride efflux transporter CrcB [Streptomyces sp. DSM 44915]|uniref:Fluoride-specific ion channel FluC n=1 Tax=Streptomyces chisholmiae TaxID=3075540 RepID=A0ABU2K207_9ACTN|nr:fluoride efflux transporter CrcB [Streptomyces sp. DSM 44915]MDT0270458.1 fluoride efflux transporter CrcB [Streptomyces sp. DSM 44915]
MTDWPLVALGGAVGALARYGVDRAIRARHDGTFPWGTLLVNLLGSLVLGGLTGALLAGAAGEWLGPLLGVGFCGALTTYSTFSYETLRLAETGRLPAAAGGVLATVGGGLGAAYAGHALGLWWWG